MILGVLAYGRALNTSLILALLELRLLQGQSVYETVIRSFVWQGFEKLNQMF